MSLLLRSFNVSVHEDDDDDNRVFWKLVTDLLRLVLIFSVGLDILGILVTEGVSLFGSWSLRNDSKVFLIQVIFLSCVSVIFFNNLPSPV